MQWTQSSYNLDNNVNILYNSIIMDNFLNSCNLDRLMQLQDINIQQQQPTTITAYNSVLNNISTLKGMNHINLSS
jgi:hypothetical protein